MRVLVVEDEPLIRWSIAETLKRRGHSVLVAGDGGTAVRALTTSSDPVDAVLLDLRLPDSTDLTLLAMIRLVSPASAVIMMTAYGTQEVTDSALALGAFDVIQKPFDMEALEPLLQNACAA